MRNTHFPNVTQQYCMVDFLDNVTEDLRKIDNALRKDFRPEVRTANTFKKVKKN